MTPFEIWGAYHQYLRMKVIERDWHGVSDAANDLRELEAKHPELRGARPPEESVEEFMRRYKGVRV